MLLQPGRAGGKAVQETVLAVGESRLCSVPPAVTAYASSAQPGALRAAAEFLICRAHAPAHCYQGSSDKLSAFEITG